ncbi:methyltransferase domain-containing protein [Helicobacter sp. 12S02634-8]|uniref:methyltransferase domain-containing protein n=1 Tax=Helicobacter sp. 12S02634-8 TaxID=1476199 RepID=UPI00209C2F63|nr:methyltransferase domain-containing protein [Helicobacter sp. 12S02634-8]
MRLLRDVGFEAFWQDKYCQNQFAKGFEYQGETIDLITSFEVFEHLPNPIAHLESMLAISQNILFSTELLPTAVPDITWEYYGFKHGQHISFYDQKTLHYLANKYHLHLNTNGHSLHLLTQKPFSKIKFFLICKLFSKGLFWLISKKMTPKTLQDSHTLLKLHTKS